MVFFCLSVERMKSSSGIIGLYIFYPSTLYVFLTNVVACEIGTLVIVVYIVQHVIYFITIILYADVNASVFLLHSYCNITVHYCTGRRPFVCQDMLSWSLESIFAHPPAMIGILQPVTRTPGSRDITPVSVIGPRIQ